MKNFQLLFLFVFNALSFFAQTWTAEQLASANTAKDISYLNPVEKEIIQYINLARLYPKLFVKIELQNYTGPAIYGDYLKNSTYKKSLIVKLNGMKAIGALTPSADCYENSKCFAIESGKLGLEGHNRKNCPNSTYAECCSYGMEAGKDIALQWLIDHDVSSLGHRSISLAPKHATIGVSVQPHKKWGTCAVAQFRY